MMLIPSCVLQIAFCSKLYSIDKGLVLEIKQEKKPHTLV